MNEQQIGAKVFPSKATGPNDPGHMCVSYTQASDLQFRGFRFELTDLPDDYHNPARFRDFLFENTIPGYIKDDVTYRSRYLYDPARSVCRIWDVVDGAAA